MTPERPVVVSIEANADLADIWSHISEHSERTADKVVRRLLISYSRLGRWAFSGRPFPELGDDIRGMSSYPFIIFYRVERDHVTVLHVFHGAMDIRPEHFEA